MFRALGSVDEPMPSLRAFRAADYSVLVQSGAPMYLPARYRSFHVIGIVLAPEYAIGRWDGADRSWTRVAFGEVTLHPAGPGERVVWPEGATCLYIHLRPALLERCASEASANRRVTLRTCPRVRDARIHEIGMALLALIVKSGESTPAVDSLIHALVGHIVRTYATADGASPVMLGQRTLDGVLDELRNDTGEQTITAVARSCGLTRAHFTRRFRVATGESPYAMAVRSRVERAKYLLAARRHSISEAAYEAGFVDQSHLSTTFQRLVGVTPRQFRELHDRTAREMGSTILQDRG